MANKCPSCNGENINKITITCKVFECSDCDYTFYPTGKFDNIHQKHPARRIGPEERKIILDCYYSAYDKFKQKERAFNYTRDKHQVSYSWLLKARQDSGREAEDTRNTFSVEFKMKVAEEYKEMKSRKEEGIAGKLASKYGVKKHTIYDAVYKTRRLYKAKA